MIWQSIVTELLVITFCTAVVSPKFGWGSASAPLPDMQYISVCLDAYKTLEAEL